MFGFLTGYAPHDGSFAIILPLCALAALLPALLALYRDRSWRLLSCTVLLFAAAVLLMGLSFAALSIASGLGAAFLASRYAERTGKRLMIAGATGLFLALVLEPAGLALGLWHYDAVGLYYSVPPSVMLTWFCFTAAGAVLGLRLLPPPAEVPRGVIVSTIIVLAVATGVCIAFGLWPAALLGLLLLQFGFHVQHYV